MLDEQDDTAPPAPPFSGIIETTLDALLVFEASRRGIIPRITRRLAEKERGMIQSGAVFVFDEGESGIKRWTDGLYWSPSRILSNFLVYRETDKRADRHNPLPAVEKSPQLKAAKPKVRKSPPSSLSNAAQSSSKYNSAKNEPTSPEATYTFALDGSGAPPLDPSTDSDRDSLEMDFGEVALGGSPKKSFRVPLLEEEAEVAAANARISEKARERQLVGSLTTTYKFKEKGLVKKTISVSINGVAQHMVSYYSMEDALSGRLRAPSSLPELFSLDISPDYLSNKHFRFPPKVEVGPDGVHRYRGEPDEPQSPPLTAVSLGSAPPASTTEVKAVKPKPEPKRRGSKASTSSTNSGHQVAGSASSWQAAPIPTSWGGRPSSPHRLQQQQQQLRPPRPHTLQRRASEQSAYESQTSPHWSGNPQHLSEHQLQYQQQQPRQPHPIPDSSRHQQSPPSSASSSYQNQSNFEGSRVSLHSPFGPPGSPFPDPSAGPSVLARPVEIRRQSLQIGIGMERRESAPGSSTYAVSPSRGSFPRGSRMFHPYAAGGDNGSLGELSSEPMKRRSTQSSTGRAPSPTSSIGRAFPVSPTFAPSAEDLSPAEGGTPPLDPEQEFTDYSYVPPSTFDHPPPLAAHHQRDLSSSSHPHPLQHVVYQHPIAHSSHPHSPHQHHYFPPQHHAPHQSPILNDPFSQHQHQQPQPYSVAPSPYGGPPHQQQSYYDPSGRGPTAQAYDQYGRPLTMDPYGYSQQHHHQQAMDDRRFASGMVGGGGAPMQGGGVEGGVKEEDVEHTYAWGYEGAAQQL